MPEPSIPPPEHVVEIDEDYFAEWVQFGFREFAVYLGHHTAFAVYLDQQKEVNPPCSKPRT